VTKLNKILVGCAIVFSLIIIVAIMFGGSCNIKTPVVKHKVTFDVVPAPVPAPSKTNTVVYTVKQGDNIWKIVKKQGKFKRNAQAPKYVDRVIELNPQIEDPDLIHPGDELVLPIIKTTINPM